jgi:hypothetical protein
MELFPGHPITHRFTTLVEPDFSSRHHVRATSPVQGRETTCSGDCARGGLHGYFGKWHSKSQGRGQIRVVGGSSSYLSQSPPGEVWSGAGQARAIDEMEVLWPDGGTRGALGLWRVR